MPPPQPMRSSHATLYALLLSCSVACCTPPKLWCVPCIPLQPLTTAVRDSSRGCCLWWCVLLSELIGSVVSAALLSGPVPCFDRLDEGDKLSGILIIAAHALLRARRESPSQEWLCDL